MRISRLTILSAGLLIAASAGAAPRGYYQDANNETAIREMRDTIEDVRHTANNNETELREIDERLKNMETIIDTLRTQIGEQIQGSKELLKSSSKGLEAKIGDLELTTKGLVSDLRQIKNHANDTSGTFVQYKQKLLDLEKIIEVQSQNIDSLQSALKSMMEALQIKDSGGAGSKIYRVKPGDTLDKIALANQTTVKALKEINNLSNDRIIVGQKLQLP